MAYDDHRLNSIFDKTDGHCNYCVIGLSWGGYGKVGSRRSWEVDHKIPLSRGGTNHLRNLVPACIPCNRSKGALTAREFVDVLESEAAEQGLSIQDVAVRIAIAGGAYWVLRRIGDTLKTESVIRKW